jgi:hypothetical protein
MIFFLFFGCPIYGLKHPGTCSLGFFFFFFCTPFLWSDDKFSFFFFLACSTLNYELTHRHICNITYLFTCTLSSCCFFLSFF